MLVKCQGHIVRLRPVGRRFHWQVELEPIDDDWLITRVDADRKVVELGKLRCDHCASLGFDHLRSYRI